MINEFAMNNFVIEKGIDRESQRIKWPYARMEIGESVFIPLNFSGGDYDKIIKSAHSYGASCGAKFETKRTIHEGIKGVRIWKI